MTQLLGKKTDAEFADKMADFSREAYDSFIGPQLPVALKDCAAAPAILSKALGWARRVQLLWGDTKFKAEVELILQTYDQAKIKCMSYRASGQNQGAVWSGVVCNLAQPFTLMLLTSGGDLQMPFAFVPTDPRAGAVSFDVTAKNVHWTGSGSYTVQGADSLTLNIVGQIKHASYTSSGQQGFYDIPFNIDLTQLGTNECGQPKAAP